jgi:HEPN domain-containing protein
MKALTQEWLDKAEGDWNAALLLFRARKSPNYDAACFHTQQCAEKYLKARLEEAGINFSKTHNLPQLLSLILPIEPTWLILQPALLALNIFSVDFRYPGMSAVRADAKDAVNHCRSMRHVIRLAFGLPV